MLEGIERCVEHWKRTATGCTHADLQEVDEELAAIKLLTEAASSLVNQEGGNDPDREMAKKAVEALRRGIPMKP